MLKKIYHNYLFRKLKLEYLEELETIDLFFVGSEKLKLKYYKLAKLQFIKKLKNKGVKYKWEEVCKEKDL